jgi:DNA-binding PadR family transcriptional regulator
MAPRSHNQPSPTPLTYLILLALADASRHGYGIIKEIEARHGVASAPSTGALYLALQRMEGEGLIEDAPAPAGRKGDPRRRYYHLTPAGRRAAEAESARLAALVAAAREKKLLAGGPA